MSTKDEKRKKHSKDEQPPHERRERGDMPRQAPKPGRGQVPEKNANQDPKNPAGAR